MHIHTCMHIHTSTTTTHSLTHNTVLRASRGGLRRESRLIAVAPFSFQAQCATPTLGHNSPSPVAHHHSLIHYHHSLTHPQHSPECIARKSQAGAPSLWGTRVMLLIRLVIFPSASAVGPSLLQSAVRCPYAWVPFSFFRSPSRLASNWGWDTPAGMEVAETRGRSRVRTPLAAAAARAENNFKDVNAALDGCMMTCKPPPPPLPTPKGGPTALGPNPVTPPLRARSAPPIQGAAAAVGARGQGSGCSPEASRDRLQGTEYVR